jgi:hypothetical protein
VSAVKLAAAGLPTALLTFSLGTTFLVFLGGVGAEPSLLLDGRGVHEGAALGSPLEPR